MPSKSSFVKLVKFESALISDILLSSKSSFVKLVKFERELISDISFIHKFSSVKLIKFESELISDILLPYKYSFVKFRILFIVSLSNFLIESFSAFNDLNFSRKKLYNASSPFLISNSVLNFKFI